MSNFRDSYKAVFGEDYVEEKYKMMSHSFTEKSCGKSYCRKCGLIALNNDFSRWSVDKGCLSEYHPQYKQMRRKFTKLEK